jgi:hypothetical protein
MKQSRRPRLTLPEPIKGDKDGSFAQNTIIYRLPDNARRVIDENDFGAEINESIERLIEEIPEHPIRPFVKNSAPDRKLWTDSLNSYVGKTWLEVPWFFAEQYFYRRILEASAYFENGVYEAVDPYQKQKSSGLTTTIAEISRLADFVSGSNLKTTNDDFKMVLETTLWGNQHDLSLWPVDENNTGKTPGSEFDRHLLIDQSSLLVAYLDSANKSEARIDIIVDNAGFELVCDLYFVDFMLHNYVDMSVVLHAKPFPTFVSDATIKDITETFLNLRAIPNNRVRDLACRLQNYLDKGKLKLMDDHFWISPYPFWEMPQTLYDKLSCSDLVIVKGDMNYRRLLGDLDWPFDTRFEDIVNYFPAPLLALRTLKSEIACGLTRSQLHSLSERGFELLTSGNNGVIQFYRGTKKLSSV